MSGRRRTATGETRGAAHGRPASAAPTAADSTTRSSLLDFLLRHRESLGLVLVVALALSLRLTGLAERTLDHFDEGVYVSSAMRVAATGDWLDFPLRQELYAPPLYSWCVAAVVRATGVAWPTWGALVSALFGGLTPLALYWALRGGASRRVALLAAALVAASDLHIAYSRMALTDASLSFWFCLALGCATRLVPVGEWSRAPSLRGEALGHREVSWRRRLGWGAAMGLCVLAAWHTKYNGWMPAAIAIAASVWAGAVRGNGLSRRVWLGVLTACVLVGVAARVGVSPWRWHVESSLEGGYAAVTGNHRRYLGTWLDWPAHGARLALSLPALRHHGWLATLVGWLAMLGVALSGAGARLGRLGLLVAATMAPAALLGGGDAVLLGCGAAAIPLALWSRNWLWHLVAVWLGAFLVLTPFYYPYLRLLVPSVPAAAALTAFLWELAWWPASADVPRATTVDEGRGRGSLCMGLVLALVVGIAQPLGWLPLGEGWRRWSSTAGYGAFQEHVRLETPDNALVLCQGQPVFSLYVPRESVLLDDIDFTSALAELPPGREVYLAVDFSALYESAGVAAAGLRKNLDLLAPVAVVPFRPGVPMLLDHLSPAEWAAKLAIPPTPLAWRDSQGRAVPVPPLLSSTGEDVLVLYRVER